MISILRRRVVVCQQFTELVTDYLEGALPRGLVKAIDRHLVGCPHCTEYLAQMRRTIELTSHLDTEAPTPEPPPEMLDALQRAFDEFHRTQED